MSIKKFMSYEKMKKTFKLNSSFAELIKTHRLCEEKSQTEYARSLNISPQTLCDLEKGCRIPSPKRAFLIAQKIAVLPDYAVESALNDSLKKQELNLSVSISKNKKAS